VWREIESVAPPRVPVIPNRMLLLNVTPSPETEALAQEKQKRFRKTLLAAFPVGLVTGFLLDFPQAIGPLLVIASSIRQFLNPEKAQTGFLQALFQSNPTPASNPALEPFVQRQQQLEAAYNELDTRWQQEASESRFFAKFQELETGKLGYANLASARAQRLTQLEAQARTDQRQIFLRQYPLQAAAIKGIGDNLAATLHAHGIQTAADVEATRLKAVPGIGEARAQVLLNWRRDIEQQFVFDAQRAISPQRRLQLEQEFDALRARLEQELSSGAAHLRRFQQEIKSSQEVLYEPLLTAQRSLAQAEMDLEIARKQKPTWPVIVMRVLSFGVGSWIEDYFRTPTHPPPARQASSKSVDPPLPPPPPKPLTTDLSPDQQASQWYHEGVSLLQREQYGAAMERFEKVVALKAAFEADAYQGLGEAFQRIGKYKESIQATQQSLRLRESAEAYQTLGLAHLGLKDWASAKTAFQNLAKVNGTSNWERGYWQAHYNLVRTTQVLKEAQTEMATLDMVLAENPNLIEERFQLAALQSLTGKRAASRQNLAILKTKHPPAADALRQLLRTR